MSTAVRLDDQLIRAAEAEALSQKRSPPKQIELWAELGKRVAGSISSNDLNSILSGYAVVKVEPIATTPIDPATVFATVNRTRGDESLANMVSEASVRYEVSNKHPGLLDKVLADGTRETGYFSNGAFTSAD